MIRVIDTFDDFKKVFENNLGASIDDKIKIWEKDYINKYPELEKKCKGDHESFGYDWREIAQKKVFNRTKADFEKMLVAHQNIMEILDIVNSRVSYVFNIDLDINIVIYCGLSNGAGWVDTYDNKRAILYGIDKIAELSWHTKEQLRALLSHELCHVIHFHIRGEDNIPKEYENNSYNYGVWRMYTEGFAQCFQHVLLGQESRSRSQKWVENCQNNETELKDLYYKAMQDEKEGVTAFYGDWHKVLGISDTGYYLGERLCEALNDRFTASQLASIPFDILEKEVIRFLQET